MTGGRLVLATGNRGKVTELRAMLPTGVDVVTAGELGIPIPEETGETLAENAELKAVGISRGVPDLVLADDSGLEVAALGNAPGVRSARYAGEPADDRANIARLLRELGTVGGDDRSARFACVLCLARAGKVVASVSGTVEGRIGSEPRGEHGFGYDPVFVLPDGRTMAELTREEKAVVSHRAAALRALRPTLVDLLDLQAPDLPGAEASR